MTLRKFIAIGEMWWLTRSILLQGYAFDDHWSPKIVSQYYDNDIIVVKVLGEFVWHYHADINDFFLVLKGRLTFETEQGSSRWDPADSML